MQSMLSRALQVRDSRNMILSISSRLPEATSPSGLDGQVPAAQDALRFFVGGQLLLELGQLFLATSRVSPCSHDVLIESY